MINNIYTLPEVDFVGGSTNKFLFHVYRDDKKTEAADLEGSTANFSLVNFINKNGTPIISKSMTLAQDDDACILSVTLTSEDTVNLSGKYVYQITIVDSGGRAIIPNQGVMYIHSNINRGLLTG